jgi:hypothetical protein
MEWWVWVVLVLAVLALLAFTALGVQERRRRGGVIAGGRPRRGKGGSM